jgi:hypothetical protein
MRAGPERRLQQAIAEFSAVALPDTVWWGCIPGGDGRRTLAPGYRSGTPDWLVIFEGRAIFFEFKAPKGIARVTQKDAAFQLHKAGALVHLIRSVDGYEEALRIAGVPLRATASGRRLLEQARDAA